MTVTKVQFLMEHADLQVLRRYLKQTDNDLMEGYAKRQLIRFNLELYSWVL
jgi:hypothetical protein